MTMLDLATLSSEDLALVCRKTGEECGCRLSEIAEASDPSDAALQDLLEWMAVETWLQAQSVEGACKGGRGSASPRLSPDQIVPAIRGMLSSLTRSLGEGKLHRDAALYHAESLEDELAWFYRKLAEHAREDRVKEHCTGLSDRERDKLQFLREVIL